jgi:mono/diheme cytochrome c family protein
MKNRFATALSISLAGLLLLGLPLAAITFASCTRNEASATSAPGATPLENTAAFERGRYLVEQVGMCADCHTPRDEQGRFRTDRWLAGAPLPFRPTVPMPWADAAPPIAGLPSLDDEAALRFLTTGELPGGRRPRPPMPEFRFAPEDAAAVVAYLRRPTPPTTAASH